MEMLDEALACAANGWKVFPAHGIINGKCTCGRLDCSSPGKHPIFQGGFNIASNNISTVRSWFSGTDGRNLAIATGAVSNLLVVDIDEGPGKTGNESLLLLQEKLVHLPNTLTVKTGGGGRHFYFEMPAKQIDGSVGKLAPYIDVRANGGYVIAPPSRHISGNSYSWINNND
jgi:hypothetical protein